MVGRKQEQNISQFVAESVPGLSEFVEQELLDRFNQLRVHLRKDGEVRFSAPPSPYLDKLKTAQAVYSVEHFNVPRPKALLGNEQYRRLLTQIETVLQKHQPGTFNSFHLAAAGSDSSVMTRLKETISQQLGLRVDNEAGDLLLRVRRTEDGEGWETLVRLTPRPLATRYWRVCDMPGALNATVAHVMSLMASPDGGILCNIASGSGSILIEHAAIQASNQSLGIELDSEVLACAEQNIAATRLAERIQIIHADASVHIPAVDSTYTALCADLPFGQRTGSHSTNLSLYPAILREAARVAVTGARFVILSHEVRLMTSLLNKEKNWHLEQEVPITLRGLHPRLYLLRCL